MESMQLFDITHKCIPYTFIRFRSMKIESHFYFLRSRFTLQLYTADPFVLKIKNKNKKMNEPQSPSTQLPI